MTIYKYPIDIRDEQLVKMPKDAKILTVQMQGDNPTLWALVDEKAEKEYRKIRIIGTGHPIPDADSLTYIGTIQERMFLWHVFEA